MNGLLLLSAVALGVALTGLALGAFDVRRRVRLLRSFRPPEPTPPLPEYRKSAEDLILGARGGLFGEPGLDVDRAMNMMNELRASQQAQAEELRELAHSVAGIAGVTDRPGRLWLSFGLIAGGTLLAGIADVLAAASC